MPTKSKPPNANHSLGVFTPTTILSRGLSQGAVAILVLAILGGNGWAGEDLFSHVSTLQDRTTHRSSSYDRTGGNEDNVPSFAPGQKVVLLDTEGPGQITHLWMTLAPFRNHRDYLHELVIRMYCEGSETPSVEVPLGAFFGQWHGLTYRLESLPVAVGWSDRAFNCFWKMPFYRHARIEVENIGARSIRRFYFQVDYELGEIPPDQGLFHAEFRRAAELRTQSHEGNLSGADNYVLLATQGRGNYAGCFLFVDSQGEGWWGEGDEMTFIDGSEKPVLYGTGAEDYFLNAWGYDGPFSYPFYGAPLVEKRKDGTRSTVYRWHLSDPVRFQKDIRVTLEHLLGDIAVADYASVAFWYQQPAIEARPPLPSMETLAPHPHPEWLPPAEAGPEYEVDGTELEKGLRRRGLRAGAKTSAHGMGYRFGGYLTIEEAPSPLEIEIPVPHEGSYEVSLRPVNDLIPQGQPWKAWLDERERMTSIERKPTQREVENVLLGRTAARDGEIRLFLEGGTTLGIDSLTLRKVEP